ncbi:hypothetical protein Droror1_Dr00025112 [Drosera rotundifolia]
MICRKVAASFSMLLGIFDFHITAAKDRSWNLQCMIQKCAKSGLLSEGNACHAHILQSGLQLDILISNMLINMYCKCGTLGSARQVLEEMPQRSIISWNTIIGAYAQIKLAGQALSLFMKMRKEIIQVNEFTISSVLCACAAQCAIFECTQLHGLAVKTGILSNVYVGTALVDAYARCASMDDASRVFDILGEKTDVTWSTMVTGFVRNKLYEEALMFYRRTNMINIKQNNFTVSSVLSACASLAAFIEGKQVHAILCKVGLETGVYVSSSLLDMYARCGSIAEAYVVFSEHGDKNVVLWNTMLSGFSRHGRWRETIILFEKMQQSGLSPTEVTFVSLLSVCGHMGLVEEARKYFDLLGKDQYVPQTVIHYSCLVDALCRAGQIHDAYDLIKSMPFEATASMWGAFLAACRKYGNLELAEVAAKCLFDLEPTNAGNHILLSDAYAANKQWEDVARSRKTLKESEAKKEKGKSWIEIKDKVHTFMAAERGHPRVAEIYVELDELIKEIEKIGYKAQLEHDFHDVDGSRKEELLRQHSEKLAVTFGIMSLPSGAPIRIMKNLRICGDCHSFMKFVSKVIHREIVVRDVNRFHHFAHGHCSCRDFW